MKQGLSIPPSLTNTNAPKPSAMPPSPVLRTNRKRSMRPSRKRSGVFKRMGLTEPFLTGCTVRPTHKPYEPSTRPRTLPATCLFTALRASIFSTIRKSSLLSPLRTFARCFATRSAKTILYFRRFCRSIKTLKQPLLSEETSHEHNWISAVRTRSV